jgi:molybdopterin-binding protein
MEISARNQIKGTITHIVNGDITSEVMIDIGGGQTIVSVITTSSTERLDLKVGDSVVAIIKSTDVFIGK